MDPGRCIPIIILRYFRGSVFGGTSRVPFSERWQGALHLLSLQCRALRGLDVLLEAGNEFDSPQASLMRVQGSVVLMCEPYDEMRGEPRARFPTWV